MVLETESVHKIACPMVPCGDLVQNPDDPITALLGRDSVSLEVCLETLVLWSQIRFGEEQVIAAKEEFDWKTGKVFHDDPFYDIRISYFLDYFVFERPISSMQPGFQAKTPLHAFLTERDPRISDPIFAMFEQLANFRHSLFQVTKAGVEELQVKDLLKNEKQKIRAREGKTFEGITKNEIFQGFLFPYQDSICLSLGTLIHSRDANRPIKRQVSLLHKSETPDPLRLLTQLAQAHLRIQRQPKINPRQVYGM